MRTTLALLLLAAACAVVQAQMMLQAIECPFPEGQSVVSQTECDKYSACEWTDGRCHMVNSKLGSYAVTSEPQDTGRGFRVTLSKFFSNVTMFGGDVQNLVLEVVYHEDYHLQFKIYDADSQRYEVPIPLNTPATADLTSLYTVGVSGVGEPFRLNVVRNSTGTTLFRTAGPLTFEDQFIQLTTWLSSTYLYGFGENTHLSFRHVFEPRTTVPIFARDQPVGSEQINEYGHHPYYMVMEDDQGNSHSVLLYNSNAMEYSTFLLDDGTPALTLRTIGGILDFHMLLGPTPETLNSQYGNLVGYTVFPTYWSLGFTLSRWGYKSTDDVRAARERMKNAGIPQDGQTFDIDYMDRSRDFTFDPVNWTDMPELVQELHDDNIKVTVILDPSVVIDFDNYPPVARGKAADAFIKWADPSLVPADQEPGTDDYMVGYVWPDMKTIFPDFLRPETKDWWVNECKLFHDVIDFDALWIDMNEPANFGTNLEQPWNWPAGQEPWSLKCPDNMWDSPPYPTKMIRVGDNESKRISDHSICMTANQTDGNTTFLHYDVHSLYGWSESATSYRAMEELFPTKRPMVLSRSTFPGSGSYAIHWLGDNSANWSHMRMSIIGMFEFNMFAMPMVGADVCGFFNEPDMEMCARWMELGSFYPFSRNHNANGTADQDPGMWPEVAQISRYYLTLRYQYLPYLYTLFHKSHMHGWSVVRPLLNVFPSDLTARDVDDQFFWGDGLMVAPVITQGAVSRSVYFPEGLWYNLIEATLAATGPTSQVVSAPLQYMPLYVRGGRILPYQEPALNTVLSRLNPFGLTVALDATGQASGDLFWDTGDELDGMHYMNKFNFNQTTLTSRVMEGQELVAGLYMDTINVYGFQQTPTSVDLNNVTLPTADWSYDGAISYLTISLHNPLADAFTLNIY